MHHRRPPPLARGGSDTAATVDLASSHRLVRRHSCGTAPDFHRCSPVWTSRTNFCAPARTRRRLAHPVKVHRRSIGCAHCESSWLGCQACPDTCHASDRVPGTLDRRLAYGTRPSGDRARCAGSGKPPGFPHGLVDRNHLSSARTDEAITVAPGSSSRWFDRNSMTEETHPARSLAPAPMTGPPALWAMLTSTAWPRGRWRAVLARRLAVGCSPGCAAGPVFPRRVRGCRSR